MSDSSTSDIHPDTPEPTAKPEVDQPKAKKKTTAKKAAKKAKKTVKKAAKKKTTAKKTAKKKVAQTKDPSEQNEIEPPTNDNPTEENTEQPRIGRVKGLGPVKRDQQEAPKEDTDAEQQDRSDRQQGRGQQRHDRRNNRRKGSQKRERPPKREIVLTGDPVEVNGMLEIAPKGFGFLRVPEKNFEQCKKDVFVPPDFIRTHGLRAGVWLKGLSQDGPRGPQLTKIESVNDLSPDEAFKLPHFEELKAINPDRRIAFETTPERFTTRVLDIVSPVGRGQRGLIVSPPRSGKTTLLLHMAEAIREKYDEAIHLIILLVDERPEEVTEFRRSLPGVEIYASSNDDPARNHARISEMCIERAKRLVEGDKDVLVLMDSITRLARAYNTGGGGGRGKKGRGYQSGGIVAGALELPRKLFAAARNTRQAGSLTILATALIQTNSRADEAIFQEFKGTGNMELVLDICN